MSNSFASAVGGAGLEPGDRFEVAPIGSTGRLSLPRVLGPDGFAIDQIEDAVGRPLESSLDPAANGRSSCQSWAKLVSRYRPHRSGWSIANRADSG